jgi:PAS domain S-box-containing protein
MRVVIVEDEILIARSAQRMLENAGYTVSGTARNAIEANEIILREQPDVVLMDIQLQGNVDGTEVARDIATHTDVPIVFTTAFGDDETIAKAKGSSPYGYVIKPYNRENLSSAIEVATNRHRLERTVRERERWMSGLLNVIHEGMIILDPDNRVMNVNPEARRLLRIEADWNGHTISGQIRLVRDDMDMLAIALEAHEDVRSEFEVVFGDIHFPAEVQISRIADDRGAVLGTMIGFIDISERKRHLIEREKMITQLRSALDNVKTLNGLLPICSHCKKIRNDTGYWTQVEDYISQHSEIEFTHGLCPDCAHKLYPEYYSDDTLA